jgi:chromo domain-containing protein 1
MGRLLRKQVRVWSLGMQEGFEYDSTILDSTPEMRHDCIEIFPVGGLIYITDDVFDERPCQALQIMKLFIAKIDRIRKGKASDSGCQEDDLDGVHWRLCVRPELMEYLFEKCEEQEQKLEAGDPAAAAIAELYTLLSDTNCIEQDCSVQPLSAKCDTFPIMSERRIVAEEKPIDYFNVLASSREEANLRMIRYYGGVHIDMRRDYRHFYVVHTDRLAVHAKRWKQEIQTITDVITPERCITELSGDTSDEGKQPMFDFYEEACVRAER